MPHRYDTKTGTIFQRDLSDTEYALLLLRAMRDEKLQETDWMSFSDSPTMSDVWKKYRQALRDLPANSTPSLDKNGNLTGVEWPNKPT
jgi:hypothetical protein